MKIAAFYLFFVFLIYSLVVMSLGTPELKILIDSYFLILLLIDMPKVTRMAQFALSSSHPRRVSENLAHGMFVLAPTLTLNTLAAILLMGTGALTGFDRLEMLSSYTIIYNLVNFLIYVTFYPAGLSLILELMYSTDGRPQWDVPQIINTLPKEESQSPVFHHVRVITTSLLVILHLLCWWPLNLSCFSQGFCLSLTNMFYLISNNVEQITVVICIICIGLKFLFFYEDMDEALELRRTYIEELTQNFAKDCEHEIDHACNSTDEGISVDCNSTSAGGKVGDPQARMTIGSGSDDSSSESAWSEMFGPDLKDHRDSVIENLQSPDVNVEQPEEEMPQRSLEECIQLSKKENGMSSLTDDEIVRLVEAKHIRGHSLELTLGNHIRGVKVRRKCTVRQAKIQPRCLDSLPYLNYNYETVMGACAESVIGYMTIPLGVIGPLKLDGKEYIVPMATTEGCLVASTNRGCSALFSSGVTSRLTEDGMSRAPVLRFPGISRATEVQQWMKHPKNFALIKKAFDSTSRFARLRRADIHPAGRSLYIRFVASTGDAMGMNMLSKATEHSLLKLQEIFPDMQIVSISGNLCTDKKPAAINWIEGRGKSVVCEAIVPAKIVESTLKTTTAALCDLNIAKNLTGSAMAGSIGGFNAHAANIVTAIFIATGQDAAQNVGSSNCLTQMEPWGVDGRDLYISVTMPSIEVGTVGGGTVLAAQSACLEMLGVKGSHPTSPGQNAQQLARIICAAVLAGELSLMSALAAGHLVKSHLRHNRSTVNVGEIISSPQLPACMSASGVRSFANFLPFSDSKADGNPVSEMFSLKCSNSDEKSA
jgi:hydroxymethylglutaryl-CoA reductase (NADPH)